MCLTGNGTTLTITPFGGSAITIGRIVRYGSFSEEVPDIEDNDIETTGHMQYCPGKLIEHSTMTFDVVYEGAAPPNIGTSTHGDVVITWPFPLGLSTVAPKLSGSGFLKKREVGDTENNERIVGQYELRFDGKSGTINGNAHTPPTWTAAS